MASSSISSPSTTASPATGAFLDEMWPRVERPSSYIERLRQSAAHGRVPPAATSCAFFGLLPAVDQPRGLLRQADALVLGRLLGASRAQGRRVRSPRRSATTDRGARFAAHARRVPPRPARLASRASIEAHGIDYIPGAGRARRLRRRRRRRSRSSPGGELRASRGGWSTRTFETYWRRVPSSAATAPRPGTTTRRTSCATSARSCASAGATAPTSCWSFSWPTAGPAAGTSGPRSSAADARSRGSSATCRTRGWAPTSCARCSTCSPTSARTTARSVLAAGIPDAWLDGEGGVRSTGCAHAYGPLAYTLAARRPRPTSTPAQCRRRPGVPRAAGAARHRAWRGRERRQGRRACLHDLRSP